MDLSDDEDFYDSDQSDIGDQSLHSILKKTLYDDDDGFEKEFGEQIASEEEALGSVQEEILGKVTDNRTEEEVVLGPVNSDKDDAEQNKDAIVSDVSVGKTLNDAKEVVLDSNVLGELEKKHFFDGFDDDNFEPLKKTRKLSHEDNKDNENPHKTIIMHVPQFIRCNKSGQSIQVQ